MRGRLWTVLALLALPLAASPAEAAGQEVVVARIEGVIGPGTALYVEDALEMAERRGVPLVLELDTPGGLVDATLDIDRMLASAEVPVLAYVGPGGGAFAASAGTFILMMGQPSGMASGATIGSAQPIEVGPGGSSGNASSKVENFLVQRIRSIAERNGRDPDVAARYVTENLNQDAATAQATGMVDVVAPDVRSFLDAVDGRSARVGDGQVVLDTDGARIVRPARGLLPRTVDLLSDPTLAFILLMAGLCALIFGLANPGTYVPETIGAILLLLGLIGLGLFGVTTAGFLLLLLALVFFVAEVFTPTHGILTVAGVVTLVVAAVFLVDGPLLPRSLVRRFLAVGVTLAVLSGAVVFGVVTLAWKSRRRPPVEHAHAATARVLQGIAPGQPGQVEMWGEVWSAVSPDELASGETVDVVRREGLTLHVARPRPAEAAGTPPPAPSGPGAQAERP